ncbi:MAG: hypothetical protein OES47_10720, partial [Acidobacteriota bacterium]|nr:hypothetical protein [Acidobacteriota bacterium]
MKPLRATLGLSAANLLCLGVFAPPVVSQDQPTASPDPAGFAETVDVRIVNVDVWVTDQQGDPVIGLGAEDFEILHDGEPVAVDYFAEVRDGASVQLAASAASGAPGSRDVAPTAVFPGHVVIYFDQSRLGPSDYPALVRGLEQFLLTNGVDPERVLILRQQRALTVEAPFGSSRSALGQALERLAAERSAGLSRRAEDEQALTAIRDAWEDSQDTLGSALRGLATAAAPPGPPAGAGTSGGASPRDAVGGPGSGPGAGPDACGPFLNRIQPILDGWTRS